MLQQLHQQQPAINTLNRAYLSVARLGQILGSSQAGTPEELTGPHHSCVHPPTRLLCILPFWCASSPFNLKSDELELLQENRS